MTLRRTSIGPETLQTLMQYERFDNEGSPNQRSFTSSVSKATSPHLGPSKVPVPVVRLPEGVLPIGNVEPFRTSGIDDHAIPVHPDIAGFLGQDARLAFSSSNTFLTAQPTASGRVLLLESDQPYFIKLSYPGVLGRYPAPLSRNKVESGAIACSALARAMSCHVAGCSALHGYLDDVGALVATAMSSSRNGELVAIARPAEIVHNTDADSVNDLVPFFSLIAVHGYHPEGPTACRPLVDIVASSTASASTISELLIGGLIESMRCLLLHHGLIPEPHAQNILLARGTDPSGSQVFFPVWRDMQSWHIDRRYFNETEDPTMAGRYASEGKEAELLSAQLDSMFWTHLIAPLLGVVGAVGVDPAQLLNYTRLRFTEAFLGRHAVAPLPVDCWWSRPLRSPLQGEWQANVRVQGSSPLRIGVSE